MADHKKYMERCLSLAGLAAGLVAPNPMVGCVIVHNDRIIGEGYHHRFGGSHAEVLAVKSVKNREWLKESTLYVSMEPCVHFGKTPPCTGLIIREGIPRVVIGTSDPFPLVAGKGIEMLNKAGIKTESGILENECRDLNRRFFTYHLKKRPYIILKWAQSADGFIGMTGQGGEGPSPVIISNPLARRLVHKGRAEEDAILVGRVTALTDDPALTVREWSGKNPLRAVIDKNGTLPRSLRLFDRKSKTIVFTKEKDDQEKNLIHARLDFDGNIPRQIAARLYDLGIQSLIVEGGYITLYDFIASDMWDEAQIYTGSGMLFEGTPAPPVSGTVTSREILDDNTLLVLRNERQRL